jgi:hypothetical protein
LGIRHDAPRPPRRRWPGIGAGYDDVDPDDGELIASFDGRTITHGFGELDTLVPAYAATIHNSQGSEYPAVVIPVMTQHYAYSEICSILASLGARS